MNLLGCFTTFRECVKGSRRGKVEKGYCFYFDRSNLSCLALMYAAILSSAQKIPCLLDRHLGSLCKGPRSGNVPLSGYRPSVLSSATMSLISTINEASMNLCKATTTIWPASGYTTVAISSGCLKRTFNSAVCPSSQGSNSLQILTT